MTANDMQWMAVGFALGVGVMSLLVTLNDIYKRRQR